MRLLAAVAAVLFLGAFWRRYAVVPRQNRDRSVLYAHIALQELSHLEELHRKTYGRYTRNLSELARVSKRPEEFLGDIGALLALEDGLSLEVGDQGYAISAKAKDRRRTPVALRGPKGRGW